MADLHISVSAEPIFSLGPLTVTNSMLVSWIITIGLCAFALFISKKLSFTKKPKGVQSFLEAIVESLFGLVSGVVGERKAKEIFPFIASFFIFILLGNWFGLLPGAGSIGLLKHQEFVPLFRGATADLNITLALAITAVVLVQYIGIKHLGIKYFSKFFVNPLRNPIGTFVGFLEIIAEFARIVSFAFRLFGNIFAGEVLLSVIAFLVPIIAPLPFLGLEIFVGLVQALVFSMLTLVFMQIATISHAEEEH